MRSKHTTIYLIILILLSTLPILADPPDPAVGKRWILNEKFSDEFNGTELDLTKWYNYHPTWIGREPGIFLPSQVSVANGYMSIRGAKMPRDTIVYDWRGDPHTYNIACGAVVSRSQEAWFGYYECRFKAAKTTMSTTFWLSTRGSSFPGPAPCNDRYSLEWDIQECIGREGNFAGSWFAKGMHSNSHIHYTPCEGEKQDLRGSDIRFEDDVLASDTFNIYGGWWKDEYGASHYFNNGEPKHGRFYEVLKSNPFDQPMGVNLVSETYPFPWISLPTDEELADSTKNICFYDWVRAYRLVDVDAVPVSENENIQNGGFESGDFRYWTGWGGNPREVVSDDVYMGSYAAHIGGPGAPEYEVNLRAYSTYMLSCYGKIAQGSGPILFGIKDPSENVLGSVQVTETAYTRKQITFTTGSSGGRLKLYFYAPNEGDEGYADNFSLVPVDVDGPKETVMFNEKLYFPDSITVKTARRSIDFRITYMANADRDICLQLFNPDSVPVGTQKYLALAGFGTKDFIMQLDSVPAAGFNYRLVADIRPIDSLFSDAYQVKTVPFDILDPVDLEITILDLLDDSTVDGAVVSLGDSARTTAESGKVEFCCVSPGTVQIRVQKEGFLDYTSSDLTVLTDTSINIRLTPVSHRLTMYVFNSHTGEPLQNALIDIAGETLETNHNGRAIHPVYAGNHQVQAGFERYADSTIFLTVSNDTTIYIGLDQVLADVKFVVKKDGTSLTGASVTMAGQTNTTSSLGITLIYDVETNRDLPYRIEHQEKLLAVDTLVVMADTTLRLNITHGVSTGSIPHNNLQIYPNPAGHMIHISGLEEKAAFRIIDVHGKVQVSGSVGDAGQGDGGLIDVSILPPGIYFLRMTGQPVLKFIIDKKVNNL